MIYLRIEENNITIEKYYDIDNIMTYLSFAGLGLLVLLAVLLFWFVSFF